MQITIAWTIPYEKITNEHGEIKKESVMEIVPHTVVMVAGESREFKIYFKPVRLDQCYVQRIDGYAYFKNQRTFRLIDDRFLTPPWCEIQSR